MIERLGVLLVSCPDSAYLARMDRMWIGVTIAAIAGMIQPRLGFVALFAGLVLDAWRGCRLN